MNKPPAPSFPKTFFDPKELVESDAILKGTFEAKFEQYMTKASEEVIQRTKVALENKKHQVTIVENASEALEYLKNNIPAGKTVYITGSTTFHQIGFRDLTMTSDKWISINKEYLSEPDKAKAQEIRRTRGMIADYFLSSVTAITEDGLMTVCDAGGSRVSGLLFAGGSVIIVVGTNKIVKDYDAAVKRTREFCLPMESARMRKAIGAPGSMLNNFVTIEGGLPNKFRVVIIKESLGF